MGVSVGGTDVVMLVAMGERVAVGATEGDAQAATPTINISQTKNFIR